MGTTPTLVVATPQTEIITAVPIVAPSPLFDMSEPMNAPTATVVELV